METSLSSIRGNEEQRSFKQDEIRRARQCRKGQGTYSKEDWQATASAMNVPGRALWRGTAAHVGHDDKNARHHADVMT